MFYSTGPEFQNPSSDNEKTSICFDYNSPVYIFTDTAGAAGQNGKSNRIAKTYIDYHIRAINSVPSIQCNWQTAHSGRQKTEKKNLTQSWGSNNSVPGKAFPTERPSMGISINGPLKSGKAPILTFEAASASSTPTDPTGAVGQNHFVNSWNTAFRIWDKNGNPLTAAASLGTIFPGTLGDPIVVYDRYADRFMLTEFFSNGFDVAISQGPDPVNDGWYVYRFNTNTFPDYPKFSVWSDGYYITANKDQNTAGSSQVVFVLKPRSDDHRKCSVQMLGFPLTGLLPADFTVHLVLTAMALHCLPRAMRPLFTCRMMPGRVYQPTI
jgi:hypothetical protein